MAESWIACAYQEAVPERERLTYQSCRRLGSGLDIQLAVAFQGVPSLAKAECQGLRQIDRAVLPTGAPDRYRNVAAVISDQCMQPVADEVLDMVKHVVDLNL